ncbi:uncharacterized protein LOC144861013 [Branchiostoma floridae x Branchiostoma japonicum]
MSRANVRATCEAAGMEFPCWFSGYSNACDGKYWGPECIRFDDGGVSCRVFEVLSNKMCGDLSFACCNRLDDVFVYLATTNFVDSVDSTSGIDADTCTWGMQGGYFYDKYALCADRNECLDSPCAHGTCTDTIGGYTCGCSNGWGGANCNQELASS